MVKRNRESGQLSVVQNRSGLRADLLEMQSIHEVELLSVGKAVGGVAAVLEFLSDEHVDNMNTVSLGLANVLESCESRIEKSRLAAAKIVEGVSIWRILQEPRRPKPPSKPEG